MSHAIKSVGGAIKKYSGIGALGKLIKPDLPNVPAAPGVPNLDEAAQNRDQLDRIKQRKGVLANIFGGRTKATAPSSGVKALLGE
jgi:hypothetical protein